MMPKEPSAASLLSPRPGAEAYIVALEKCHVTVEITNPTWNLCTERYARSLERGFAPLGLFVV